MTFSIAESTAPPLQTRITVASDCYGRSRLAADSEKWCRQRIMIRSSTSAANIVALPTPGYDGGAHGRTDRDMVASGLSAVLIAHRGALLRFLRARGAGDDVDDILQELWLKVDRMEAEGPIADPRAYLFRMADNLMHDRVRANVRRSNREQAWSEARNDPAGQDETPSAERMLAARQRLRQVERALATLGERTQSIFRRFRIDGVSQSRIAQEEGISLSAVEKHLQRAYRTVAALVDEDQDVVPTKRNRAP
jgi:RNA polymerase sigma-70 factor (ECF subfamily)